MITNANGNHQRGEHPRGKQENYSHGRMCYDDLYSRDTGWLEWLYGFSDYRDASLAAEFSSVEAIREEDPDAT